MTCVRTCPGLNANFAIKNSIKCFQLCAAQPMMPVLWGFAVKWTPSVRVVVSPCDVNRNNNIPFTVCIPKGESHLTSLRKYFFAHKKDFPDKNRSDSRSNTKSHEISNSFTNKTSDKIFYSFTNISSYETSNNCSNNLSTKFFINSMWFTMFCLL